MPYWFLWSRTHCRPASRLEARALTRVVQHANRDQARLGRDPDEPAFRRVGAVADQDPRHVRAVAVGVDARPRSERGIVGSDEVDGRHQRRELGPLGDAAVDLRDRHSRALEETLRLVAVGHARGFARGVERGHRETERRGPRTRRSDRRRASRRGCWGRARSSNASDGGDESCPRTSRPPSPRERRAGCRKRTITSTVPGPLPFPRWRTSSLSFEGR